MNNRKKYPIIVVTLILLFFKIESVSLSDGNICQKLNKENLEKTINNLKLDNNVKEKLKIFFENEIINEKEK